MTEPTRFPSTGEGNSLPSLRTRISVRERAAIKLAELLHAFGQRKHGFFIKYPYAEAIDRTIDVYPSIQELFSAHDAEFKAFLNEIESHIEQFNVFGRAQLDPEWNSSMFSAWDGAAAYAMVRQLKPQNILEIGSGDSTRYLAKAIKDGNLDTKLTCIDPEPRRDITGLKVAFERRILQNKDIEIVKYFDSNDILFIDSSHIMLPGMDVDIEFNRLFPVLKPGVVVHIHDIFLPFGYPSHWHGRFFSEQNALIGWIVSGFFDVLFPCHYAMRTFANELDRFAGQFEPFSAREAGSLWLRKA